jgi:hypothetical protein
MPEPRPYSLEQYMALPELRGLPRAVLEYHARQYQRWSACMPSQSSQTQTPCLPIRLQPTRPRPASWTS